jgi:hypothetical protein
MMTQDFVGIWKEAKEIEGKFCKYLLHFAW